MKIQIIEQKENPFLKRTDLMFFIEHTGQATPKKEEVEKLIAEEFKSVPEKIEIVYIFTETGRAKSKVKARIWKEKIVEKPKKEEKKPKVEEVKKEIKDEKPKEKSEEVKETEKSESKEEKSEEIKKVEKPEEETETKKSEKLKEEKVKENET